MAELTDIHLHALYGVDDGAKTCDEMTAIVRKAYLGGARKLCMTPHYHPGYYGDNRQDAEEAFNELQKIAEEQFPGLTLYLGNELFCEKSARDWLDCGECKTIGSGHYVLVDFFSDASENEITDGVMRLLNAGYPVILAHPERYRAVQRQIGLLAKMKSWGIVIQLDCGSVLGKSGLIVKMTCRRIIKSGLADIIASDAHRENKRQWLLDECYEYIKKKYSEGLADRLCCRIPDAILK